MADDGWQELDSTPALNKLDTMGLKAALEDASKLWLAHDGLWFLEWEKRHGIDEAIEADTDAWRQFARLEASRIMLRLRMEPGGGLEALAECLRHRLYANICRFSVKRRDGQLRLRMIDCRVQDARKRKNLAPFPCKSVGIVEFQTFAETVDKRIKAECIQCPPDNVTEGGWCEWVFSLSE